MALGCFFSGMCVSWSAIEYFEEHTKPLCLPPSETSQGRVQGERASVQLKHTHTHTPSSGSSDSPSLIVSAKGEFCSQAQSPDQLDTGFSSLDKIWQADTMTEPPTWKVLVPGHIWSSTYVISLVFTQRGSFSQLASWPAGHFSAAIEKQGWESNPPDSLFL